MKTKALKIILLLVVAIILLLVAIPSFNVKVAGKDISFRELDLRFLGINSNFPSLKEGSEIYPSTKYSAKIEFIEGDTEETKTRVLAETLNKIRDRIDYTNLFNIVVEAEKKDSDYYIVLYIPNTYASSAEYANWILNSGSVETIKFIQDETSTDENAQPQIQSIAIKDYQFNTIEKGRAIFVDIATDQKRSISIPHLVFTFSSPVQNLYGGISALTANDFQTGVAQIQMYIGSQGYGIYAHESNPNAIRAIPTGNDALDKASDVDNFLSLTQSYFMEETILEKSLTVDELTTFVNPQFNNDGAIFIAVTFIAALVLIAIYSLRTFGLRQSVALLTTLVITMLTAFDLLKILNAAVSTGFIVGFLVATILLSYLLFDMFKNGVKLIEIKTYTMFAFIPFIVTMAFSMLEYNLDLVNDIIPVIAVSMLGFIFSIQIYLRSLTSLLKIDK